MPSDDYARALARLDVLDEKASKSEWVQDEYEGCTVTPHAAYILPLKLLRALLVERHQMDSRGLVMHAAGGIPGSLDTTADVALREFANGGKDAE